MHATPADQQVLLDLARLDDLVDQLTHRRATLPERAALSVNEAAAAAVAAELAAAQETHAEAAARLAAVEEQVAALTARTARDRARLDAGAVTSAREFDQLTNALRATAAHIRELEDAALEEMLVVDEAAAAIDPHREQLTVLHAEADQLMTALAAGEAVLDAELAGAHARRTGTAALLPAELLAGYDRVRSRAGGTGAASLDGAMCTGCRLTLPAGELARLHATPPDEVATCPECRRLLVVPQPQVAPGQAPG